MKKFLFFLLIFIGYIYPQGGSTLIRRAELGDSTGVLRALLLDSTETSGLISDTADVLRNEMSAIDANVIILLYGDFSTPEEYGAIGNGVTNDAVAVKKAIDSAGTRKILFQQSYAISDSIVINTANADYNIEFTPQAEIISSVPPAEYGYWNQHGHIVIRDANKVEIKGLNLEVTNSGYKTTSDNALMITNAKEVILEGGHIKNAGFAAVRVHGADNLTIKDMLIDSAQYAGIMPTNVTHSTIIGNTINEIGDKDSMPLYGYGIVFSHQFGTGIDNQDAYVSGNKVYRAYRKSIDVHGCKNAIIDGNFVKGFGYGGIYAVNEDADANNEKYVADVMITKNIIEQDTAWYNACTPYTSGVEYYHPIQIGSYGAVPYAGGVIDVSGNIIKNVTDDSLRACISLFAGTGVAQPLFKIKNNLIEADVVYLGQGLIYLNGTDADPINIEFEGNVLKGSADNAVNFESGRTIKMSNNTIDGTFDNGYNLYGAGDTTDTGTLIVSNGDVFRGTFGKIVYGTTGSAGDIYKFNNITIKGTADTLFDIPSVITKFVSGTYNEKPLPNLISKSHGFTEFQLETSTVADTIALHKLRTKFTSDPSLVGNADSSGSSKVDYEIQVTGANGSFNGTFYVTARVADSLGTPKFYYAITKSIIDNGVEATYAPTFYFDTGTTTEKTFHMAAPAPYTSYYIKSKHSGWHLRPELSLE